MEAYFDLKWMVVVTVAILVFLFLSIKAKKYEFRQDVKRKIKSILLHDPELLAAEIAKRIAGMYHQQVSETFIIGCLKEMEHDDEVVAEEFLFHTNEVEEGFVAYLKYSLNKNPAAST